MELDKRVNEIETELKIMKGEIKELLVDIRDLVNKNENPFCSIPYHEALKSTVTEKNETANSQPAVTESEEKELNPAVEVSEPANQIVKNNEDFRKIDTFMLVELMRWVDYAVRTVGHNNLEELLNLYTLTGHLPEETKRIIENIANLSIEEPAEEDRVSMKDNITVLSQLSAILSPEGFRKNIQPLYENSQGLRDKEKEKKAGLVSLEFKSHKAERLKRNASSKSDINRHV